MWLTMFPLSTLKPIVVGYRPEKPGLPCCDGMDKIGSGAVVGGEAVVGVTDVGGDVEAVVGATVTVGLGVEFASLAVEVGDSCEAET